MLCKPANLILLISIAGTLYHLLTGEYKIVLWWLIVGIVGVATFQGLCIGNFENIAWFLMVIPVLVVCFFMAVALLASSMRIKNVYNGPCNECREKPKCNKPTCSCPTCSYPVVLKVKPCNSCLNNADSDDWPNKYWYLG